MTNVSVIIPNWNGEKYLPRCVQSLLGAFKAYPGEHEVIVVDDASVDQSVMLLERDFAFVRIVKHERNMGFSASCNNGVCQASNPVVVLLNMDTYVDSVFLEPLASHFHRGDRYVFGVGCKQVAWDEQSLLMGRMFPKFERGLIDVVHEMDDSLSGPCENGIVSCGACAFDRDKYLRIGGLASLNRRNDVDLSYRALKRGWKLVYDPRSIVYHKGMVASQKKWTRSQLGVEIHKDRILVTWRNLTEAGLLARHILALPLLPLYWGTGITVPALWYAAGRWAEVLRFRRLERNHAKLSDRQVLSQDRCSNLHRRDDACG